MAFDRLRALFDRRVRYRITGGGALFIAALTFTGAAAFASANNLLFLVFSAMLAMLLVSGFLSRLVLSGLEVELLLPQHVCAREESPARIRVRNLKRLTPSFSIELAGRPGPSKTPSIFAGTVYFPVIAGGRTLESAINVEFPVRGRHRESLFALSTRFPFGFIRKTATVILRRETIVYPSLDAPAGMELLLDDIGTEIESQRRGSGLDFYRIRPWESTDSSRLVDWKSTAHTGDLQVREFSRDEQGTVEIYLDRRIQNGQYGWFEKAVASCAFLAWTLTEREVTVSFGAQLFSLTIGDEDEIYALLRYLALVEPIGANMEPPELPDAGACFIFSMQPEQFEGSGWIPANIP